MMSVRNESRIVRKPEDALPSCLLTLELLRLRNHPSLARLNVLDIHPFHIAIRQVFAIRRNGPTEHSVFEGISCQLLQFQLGLILRKTRAAFYNPENGARNKEGGNRHN